MKNLMKAVVVALLMVPPNGANAAQAAACENECAGAWFSCRFVTFGSEGGSEYCDGFLHGCLLGCSAPANV